MKMTVFLKGAFASGALIAASFGAANAQACEETQFTATNYDVYAKAETELLVNDNAQAALGHHRQLMTLDLNCYERTVAIRLGAAIKIKSGDFRGAAADFESLLRSGAIPAADRTKTLFDISQMYLNADDQIKALDYLNQWVRAGGRPDRTTKWQMAVLNYQQDKNPEALRWAEEVFRDDGPNAERQVYDFLILLYDRTGQLGKKAQLLEQLLVKNPNERLLWDAIAGDYFKANDQRKAFEVQKAMYLAGILQTEDELERIASFYNQFNAPYQAARVLEKEMNAGRISKNYERLEKLASLYQTAREFERAIPVIEEAARVAPNGEMYFRLGRSHLELRNWAKADEAFTQAINRGGLKDASGAWVMIGQSRYEQGDREGAREAFSNARSAAGRNWLDFMRSEDNTERQIARYALSSVVNDIQGEIRICKQTEALGPTEACQTAPDRLKEAQAALAEFDGRGS
ncbi:MAG: tetratricopeptide repeat protein [Pseudomonadota bacterium]